MNKARIIILCLLSGITFTACKKQYVCYCKNYGSGQVAEFYADGKMTRGKALKYCNNYNNYSSHGYSCGVE